MCSRPSDRSVFVNTTSQPGQATFHYIRPESAKIEFQGLNRIEFLEFVHAVRCKAMQQGKQRDDEWLADYAAVCFFGEALLWHLRLPEEIQHSWKLLLNALLEKYAGPESALVPIPAAAPPQATAPEITASRLLAEFQATVNRRNGDSRDPASTGSTNLAEGLDSIDRHN